ncbi:ABC transporter permease [Candidatus Riflebacteria bacterium]
MKKLGFLLGILPVLIIIAAWEIVVRMNLIPGSFFLPAFSTVVGEFFNLLRNGVLVENFLCTLFRVLIGFITGSLAGFTVGVLMGYSDILNKAFHPVISLLYPIPALGWLPIFMIWFGIGESLPILIIFTCSFFPVVYNTATGIRRVPREFIQAAQILGANRWNTLTQVVIPLALPNIFTGFRLEAGMAWRVVIAAEMIAIPTGIGALLMTAESLIRIDIVIVCLFVLSIMCLLFEQFFLYLEWKLTSKWI